MIAKRIMLVVWITLLKRKIAYANHAIKKDRLTRNKIHTAITSRGTFDLLLASGGDVLTQREALEDNFGFRICFFHDLIRSSQVNSQPKSSLAI